MKKILYYTGIGLWGLFSGAFLADMIAYESTVFDVIVDLCFGLLFAFFVYRCYRGLERLKHPDKKAEPVSSPVQNVARKTQDGLNRSLDLVRDCLSYRQTADYPQIESQLNLISHYLHSFKDEDYEINHYITDILCTLLEEYKDIVTTPAKDTPQGKEILSQILNSLALINTTLGKLYEAYLDGKQLEISSVVEGLKHKLAADGYIGPENPFERRNG